MSNQLLADETRKARQKLSAIILNNLDGWEDEYEQIRKDGLPKNMDFNQVDQAFISSVANKRNNIPRKSLDYQTPLEVFMSYMNEDILSSLI